MASLVWKNDYSVGVEALDFDHKLLFSLINQLDDAIDDHQNAEVVGSVLGVLAEYTRFHFAREEMLMAKGGYPDLTKHHKGHDALTLRVGELKTRFAARDVGAATATRDFLAEWLTQHILREDLAYRDYVRGQRLTDEEEASIFENAPAEDPAFQLI